MQGAFWFVVVGKCTHGVSWGGLCLVRWKVEPRGFKVALFWAVEKINLADSRWRLRLGRWKVEPRGFKVAAWFGALES